MEEIGEYMYVEIVFFFLLFFFFFYRVANMDSGIVNYRSKDTTLKVY